MSILCVRFRYEMNRSGFFMFSFITVKQLPWLTLSLSHASCHVLVKNEDALDEKEIDHNFSSRSPR